MKLLEIIGAFAEWVLGITPEESALLEKKINEFLE